MTGSYLRSLSGRYGPKNRNVMDLYIPASACTPQQQDLSSRRAPDETANVNQPIPVPVALFCHGGVWATGEPQTVDCSSHPPNMRTALCVCPVIGLVCSSCHSSTQFSLGVRCSRPVVSPKRKYRLPALAVQASAGTTRRWQCGWRRAAS